MKTKTCSKCGDTKKLDDFYAKATTRDGREGVCKTCKAANRRRWYLTHPGRDQARQRTSAQEARDARR